MTGSREASRVRPALRPDRRLFGRYRLRERVGHGGSAEVWRAVDERLNRPVAIKVLREHLHPGRAWRERFLREARAAASLAHPAIVPVHDVVDDPAMPAIVFRYVRGETLAERLRRGPLTPEAALAIAADLAGGLEHAHRLGVVHRDVKPANVVLDNDGRAQLVDFGIARLLAEAAATEASGHVLGTLRYMAPEQLAGQATDGATDVYALGIVLHEMLAGRPPFTGASPADLLSAERAGPPVPPASAPDSLRQLLASMLAVEPASRPSAAAVHRALATITPPTAATARHAVEDRVPGSRARRPEPQGEALETGDTTILDPAATLAMPPVALVDVREATPAAVPTAAAAPTVGAGTASPTPAPSPTTRRPPRQGRTVLLGGLAAAAAVVLAVLALGLGSSPNPDALAASPSAAAPMASPLSADPTPVPPVAGRHRGRGGGRGHDG